MQAGLPIDVLLPIVIALMMFAVGLSLRPADFRAVGAAPFAAVFGFVAMFLLFPGLAFAVAAVFRLDAELAIGLVLLASSPSASTSTMFTYLARGDVALSVALTAVSKIVPVLTVPLYVSLAAVVFTGDVVAVEISLAETSEAIALTILLPTLAGMVIRARVTESRALRTVITRVSVTSLVVLIGVLVWRERAALPGMVLATGPAALTLCLAGMLGAYGMSSLLRIPPARRCAITIELGMQSGGTSIAIAAGVLGVPAMAVPAAVYSLVMYVIAGAYVWAERAAGGPAAGDRPAPTSGKPLAAPRSAEPPRSA